MANPSVTLCDACDRFATHHETVVGRDRQSSQRHFCDEHAAAAGVGPGVDESVVGQAFAMLRQAILAPDRRLVISLQEIEPPLLEALRGMAKVDGQATSGGVRFVISQNVWDAEITFPGPGQPQLVIEAKPNRQARLAGGARRRPESARNSPSAILRILRGHLLSGIR